MFWVLSNGDWDLYHSFSLQLPSNIPQILARAEVNVPEEVREDYNSNVAACSGGGWQMIGWMLIQHFHCDSPCWKKNCHQFVPQKHAKNTQTFTNSTKQRQVFWVQFDVRAHACVDQETKGSAPATRYTTWAMRWRESKRPPYQTEYGCGL